MTDTKDVRGNAANAGGSIAVSQANEKNVNAYVELYKEKMASIWQRRGITWKTNFVLWAGLAAVSAVLYKEAGNLPAGAWYWTLSVFIVIFIAHAWHWVGSYISDEIGFSWAHYFQDCADISLNPDLSKTVKLHHRPLDNEKWGYHLWTKHKTKWDRMSKLQAIVPQILVTAALMAVVLFLLHEKIGRQADANTTVNRGENQSLVSRPADMNTPSVIRSK